MNHPIRLKTTAPPLLITLTLLCFGLLPRAQAVVPPPDGGYPGFNTAEGQNALQSLTTGAGNTGVGWYSLFSAGEANYNTGVGAGALVFNNGDSNTAVGTVALFLNTTGTFNTAVGTGALLDNGIGNTNTAIGYNALSNNTAGEQNTAIGVSAMRDNTMGGLNTAVGCFTLRDNNNGILNTAIGYNALPNNITGGSNTAIGYSAGLNVTGDGNVCIGAGMSGALAQDNRTWIRNVYSDVATTRVAYVDSDGHVGTLSSSRRYKEEIRPMDQASEALFTLKPVTFRYKKAVDPSQALSFGLIAEEVAQVNPALITRDEQGKAQTVRYEMVNAMLLNEFLKEHRRGEEQDCKIQEQETTIAELRSEIRNLAAMVNEQASQLQKVNAWIETSEAKPQFAQNQ